MEDNLTAYRASAGSGKTFRLALEYIKLAVTGETPAAYRNVLAMTFTNKATGEMKDRILMQLYNLWHGGLDKGFANALYKELPHLSPEEIHARAGAALRSLLHDYDRFAVQTIDAFFQSMLTSLAHELGLTRSFRVDLDEEDVASRAVDRLLLRANERGGRRSKWVVDFMTDLIEQDKGWKVARLLKNFAGKNLSAQAYLRNEDTIRARLADPEAWKAFTSALREIEKKQSECLALCAEALDERIDEAGDKNIKSANLLRKYTARLKACRLWKGKSGDGDFPSKTVLGMAEEPDNLLKAADRKKPEMAAGARRVHEALTEAEAVRKTATQHIATCRALLRNVSQLRLLGEIGNEMEAINREAGRFMLSHTPELFRRMVGTEDASFVFERAGETYRHVMVDEFQDTSRLQWDNIRRLLLENLSTGDGCMIVGDVKQSIYRWRGGDWNILGNIASEMPRVTFAPPLVVNRRSLPAVIEFNNRLFPLAAQWFDTQGDEDATQRARTLYADVRQECPEGKEGGYVRIVCNAEDKLSHEAILSDLAGQVRTLHDERGVPFSQMYVLVRANAEAAEVVDYFAQNATDVPVISDEAYLLAASPAVTLVTETLRWLGEDDSPADGEAEKRKKSDGKALTLAAKSYLSIPREGADVPDINGADAPDMEQLRGRARDILPAALFEERERLRRMPLYELCERLLSLFALGGEEKQRVAGQRPYIFSLLDGVLEFLDENPSDIPAFVNFWDETLSRRSIPADEAAEGVRVLTVHKSKGLAAHTVLIPFCNWKLNSNGNGQPAVLWLETDKLSAPYNFLPVYPVTPSPADEVRTSFFKTQIADENEQERIDNLNALYVAFTRAKANLLVWASARGGNGGASNTIAAPLAAALAQMTQPEDSGTVADGTQSADSTLPYGTLREEEIDFDDEEAGETGTASETDGGETEEGKKKSKKSPTLLYTSGEPQGFAAKTEQERDESQDSTEKTEQKRGNPLEIHSSQLAVSLHTEASTSVEFVQSNRAKDFLAAADGDEGNEEQARYISRGNLLHRVFSTIERAEDAPAALQALSLEGVFAGREEEEQVRHLVTESLASPQAAGWFDGSWRVLTEQSIITREKDGIVSQQRPDRVMTRGEETVVVDFKFGRPNPDHKTQVWGYMNLLREMGMPGVRGYLWYVYSGVTEEVPG